MVKAAEVRDLSEETPSGAKALQALERNFSHMLISANKEKGPRITFGDTVLTFRPQVPATAMTELLSNDNKVEGLKNYIKFTLEKDSRDDFERLQDDLPLEALNAIVEVISEAATPFPTAKQ